MINGKTRSVPLNILSSVLASISKLRREEIESVTKHEKAMCWPECFKTILKSEMLKHVYFCVLNFHFCVYHEIPYFVYVYLREKKTPKSVNQEMLPSW